MAASIYPNYPPALTSEQSHYLLSNIKDWSILNGLAVRPSSSFVSKETDPSRSLAVTAPVTLFPSLFPRACFEEARAIQTAYNELYACIANDKEWLGEVVKEYACISYLLSARKCLHLCSFSGLYMIWGKSSTRQPHHFLGINPIYLGGKYDVYYFLILCMQIGRSG